MATTNTGIVIMMTTYHVCSLPPQAIPTPTQRMILAFLYAFSHLRTLWRSHANNRNPHACAYRVYRAGAAILRCAKGTWVSVKIVVFKYKNTKFGPKVGTISIWSVCLWYEPANHDEIRRSCCLVCLLHSDHQTCACASPAWSGCRYVHWIIACEIIYTQLSVRDGKLLQIYFVIYSEMVCCETLVSVILLAIIQPYSVAWSSGSVKSKLLLISMYDLYSLHEI